MRFQFPDGQVVMMDQKFSREGFNYPAEWLRQMSVESRLAWGLTELPEPETPVTPAPPTVPQVVTPLQARKALLAMNMLDTVETMLATAPREAQLAWEYAIEIRRTDPTLLALAQQLNLSEQTLDDIFILAGTL